MSRQRDDETNGDQAPEPGVDADRVLEPERGAELAERADEPPVVARMIIEIRSDGSRTIARGALEDVPGDQKVAIEARGDTPLQLAMALARSLFKVPSLTRGTVRALLPSRKKKR